MEAYWMPGLIFLKKKRWHRQKEAQIPLKQIKRRSFFAKFSFANG
jgi:hypothetical protein